MAGLGCLGQQHQMHSAAAGVRQLLRVRRGLVPCLPAAAFFLLFSTRCVNTKYCIRSGKVHETSLLGPLDRDIAVSAEATCTPTPDTGAAGAAAGSTTGTGRTTVGSTLEMTISSLTEWINLRFSGQNLVVFTL